MKSKIYNANFVYFISMILFVLVRILAQVGALSFMGDYANFVINLIIQVGIVLLLPLFLFSILNKQKVGKTLLDCSYNKIGAKEIFAAIGLGFVVYFLNIFITLFFIIMQYAMNTVNRTALMGRLASLIPYTGEYK